MQVGLAGPCGRAPGFDLIARARACLLSVLFAAGLMPAAAQTPSSTSADPPPASRPRIGLALSGGGARGFAHVGVLRVLESLRVPIDCIAGTSAGSAIGAAYASGLSPDQIERRLRLADWDRDMFHDAPPREALPTRRKSEEKAYMLDLTLGWGDGQIKLPPGLVAGQKIELFLHKLLESSTVLESFDQLPIPFRAMATDLEQGDLVVQSQGSLVTAVRASMAVPSVFSPVVVEGKLLVDGGLSRNLPVDIVRDMCADVVIAVDIGSPLLKRSELGNVLSVASQMVSVLMERNMRESRAEIVAGRDVLIRPELGDISAGSFSRGVDGIPAGEAATRGVAAQLATLTLNEVDYAAWQAQRAARIVRDDRYQRVRIVGVDPATRRAIRELAKLPNAGTLDQESLNQSIDRINGMGDFERIGYGLIPDASGQTLQLNIVERTWGPNFVRFGFGGSVDSKSNGAFSMMAGFRRPRINDWAGEFKAEGQIGSTSRLRLEFFQPFSRSDLQMFVVPQLLAEEVPVWIFQGNSRVAEYSVRTLQASGDLGIQGRLGEFRLGVMGGSRDSLPRTGALYFPRSGEAFYGVQARVLVDQLDTTDFPRKGYLFGLNYRTEKADGDAGAYTRQRAIAFGRVVKSFGDHTFGGSFRVGEGSNLALDQLFHLGGFMNVSGLQFSQVLGSSIRYANLNYQYQLLTLPDPIGRGVYAGLAIETGRISDPIISGQDSSWVPGVSAFLGANTSIGPVYVGFGQAGKQRLAYLFLGRPGL
jgi:NTE family protein